MGYTRKLAEYVAGHQAADLPVPVVEKAKQLILDLFGSAIRASRDAESTPAIRAAVLRGATTGDATLIGEPDGGGPRDAAFFNASLAHSLDFDDTHRVGSVHPGAAVIPTALAIAETDGLSGSALIHAVVLGYDVTCRLAAASGPKAQYDRGFHPTGTCGVFGATAAAGKLIGLDADALENAFGVNGSQASGSLQFFDNGAWNKRIHPGIAAASAVMAANLAGAGFLGASRAIEGSNGFFVGYGRLDPRLLTRGLGRQYAVIDTGIKPYPACRYAHAPLDMIVGLTAKHRIRPDEIESITIGLCDAGVALIGRPVNRKASPQNVVDAQFSMPFLAAVAATRQQMKWGDYELLGDPDVRKLARSVKVIADEEANRAFPRRWLATVAIRARGRTYADRGWRARGEPESPLDWPEVEEKFFDLAEPIVGLPRAKETVQAIRQLDTARDVRALGRLLRATDDRTAPRTASSVRPG